MALYIFFVALFRFAVCYGIAAALWGVLAAIGIVAGFNPLAVLLLAVPVHFALPAWRL